MLFDSHTDDAPGLPSYIYQAYQLTYKTFLILGAVQGVNIQGAIQASPNLDSNGNFFFMTSAFYWCCNLTFGYQGKFHDGSVTGVSTIPNISLGLAYQGTLAPQVSNDGSILIYSNFHYDMNLVARSGHLVMAGKNRDGSFTALPYSDDLLVNVNAIGPMVYNGIIAPGGLELYFTAVLEPNITAPQIYVTKRNALTEPFGVPQLIVAAGDAVENGNLSRDGKHLYYHRVLGRSDAQIYVLTRP